MNKYGQYCPIARATEILGDRWTLLIVREFLYGVHHFCELERGLPGIPRAILAERLRRLQQVGVVEKQVEANTRKTSYQLTPAGQELQPILDALLYWGAKWAFGEPKPDELDPLLLLWWIRASVKAEHQPNQRIVIEFDFCGQGNYWLLMLPGDVSLCLKHPGFDNDVLVIADLAAYYQVYLGRVAFSEAVSTRLIQVEALPSLVRAFPSWFNLSPVAEVVREFATYP